MLILRCRFDVFHQLHCLNQIRQALHRDVYPEIPIHGAVHTGQSIRFPFKCISRLMMV